MQVSKKHLMVVPLIATLAACASLPDGPTVQAMPGSGKTFDQFQADDYSCRGYASNTAGNPQDAQVNSTLGSAALGTAVGALAGAAIGGGRGAGVGAGAGLLFGTAAGADAGNASGYSVQRRYDMAYSQCMYAKGEKVPMGRQYQSSYAPPPPPPSYGPPPGYAPPPPPPGYGAPQQYAPPPGAPPGYPN
jgi:outer membrane lipoprotein SlyB